MDPAELMRKNIEDICRKLIAGSLDQDKARSLVDDLRASIDFLLMPSVAKPQGRFTHCKMAREAIVALLEETKRPMTEWEIKEEIVDKGGFRRGPTIKTARLVIQKSLKVNLNGHAGREWPLKRINGMYGLKEWPEYLFEERK